MNDDDPRETLVELMRDMRTAMLTTFGPEGPRSVPMARQDVDPDAEMWFITGRDARHTQALAHDPQVVLTFSSNDAWVGIVGRGEVVDDQARLDDLWNPFAEAWLPGGREDGSATLLRVEAEQAEYWNTPGGTVATLVSLVKTRLTGDTYDTDHEVVEP